MGYTTKTLVSVTVYPQYNNMIRKKCLKHSKAVTCAAMKSKHFGGRRSSQLLKPITS
jgi:hypothetical protein